MDVGDISAPFVTQLQGAPLAGGDSDGIIFL